MNDKTFKNKSLVTKTENDLIETLISNETKIHNYKNKIELIQKLGDGNIIVISRKTVANMDSTNPKKVNKITTINLIEEAYDTDSEYEKQNAEFENPRGDIKNSFESHSLPEIKKEEKIRKTKKMRKKKNYWRFDKERVEKAKMARANKISKIKYNFADAIKKTEGSLISNTNSNFNNNFNNLSAGLKLNESDNYETLPDSIKQFDIQSIVDSVAENRKIRVTRSKIKNIPHSSYFLSQLNDVRNVSSVRVRSMDNITKISK